MDVRDKVVVVTGGGNGIGRALCERFAREGAASVVVSDCDEAAARHVADAIGGVAHPADVACEEDVQELVAATLRRSGRIDLFCSNAGITVRGGVEVPDADWTRLWNVNVMSHVFAARAVLPGMLARGQGYLLQTASAAGLLTEIGSAPYSATKHATVALAEWLAVTHHAAGLRVSCLCPMGVATDFLDETDPVHRFLAREAVTVEQVAQAVIEGLADERFLILPHPDVAEFFARKGSNYERWLSNFRRLGAKLRRENPAPRPQPRVA